jgi:mRNA-degrading endonuclease RelE of RelBE toxin-antitoxin system
MPKRHRYDIVFDEKVIEHLNSIESKYHHRILDEIEELLSYEPGIQTRNRKALIEPTVFGVAWEIRFGQPDNRFRAFYRIDDDVLTVYILAILVKKNNKLYLGDQEFRLDD